MQQPRALRYPDFICIGAQKAGTSWLYRMLRQHPDIWLPPIKELHYFNRAHRKSGKNAETGPTALDLGRMDRVARTIRWTTSSSLKTQEKRELISCLELIGAATLSDEWYGTIFGTAPMSALCGEITPEYALLPERGVKHMLRLQPKLKLIFLLRDPIERGWSHLRMEAERGRSHEAVQWTSRPGFLSYADYMSTIERYRAHVPAPDFLTLFFDDIVERPRFLLEQACAFLGLDCNEVEFQHMDEPVHLGPPQPMEPDYYAAARERLAPIYRRLLALENPIVERWHATHYAGASTHLIR